MTPQFRIQVEGQGDVTAQIRERLMNLRVRDEEGYGSDVVEIRLDDRSGEMEVPRRGVALEVELGYEASGRVSMGRYVVDWIELSGPPEMLTVRARAADMRTGAKQRKTRSWDQVTIGDLVATIAREHDLEPRVARGLAGIVLPHVDQTDESDLHLLTRLGREVRRGGQARGRQTGVRTAGGGAKRDGWCDNGGAGGPRAGRRLPGDVRRSAELRLG